MEVFGDLNLVSLSVFFLFFVLLKKSGPIFTALHEKQTLSSDENSDRL